MNIHSYRLFSIAMAVLIITAGCHKPRKSDTTPLVTPQTVADSALEATGQIQAWQNTRKITANCIVTYYRPDKSAYITQQQHYISPWSEHIRITADEPAGIFDWQFSKNGLIILKIPKNNTGSFSSLLPQQLAKMALTIFSVPTGFSDKSHEASARIAPPVLIHGTWYYPMEIGSPIEKILYQNINSAIVDIVWLADRKNRTYLRVCGYNYRQLTDSGVLVPTKVEIFETDSAGTVKQRIVQIDYYAISNS